jgi:hypothetical protein
MSTQNKIKDAAQAVINRWDSPSWEWDKKGGTANLISDLRNAIEQAQPSQAEDLEAQAQRFFMAWPNGDIPAMLAAFARCLAQPSAPTADVHAIAEDLTAHLAKMSLPTDPHGWKVIVRIALIARLTKLLTNP